MQKYSYKMLKYLYALWIQKIVNKLQNFNTLFCHVYGRQNNCFWWHHWVSVFSVILSFQWGSCSKLLHHHHLGQHTSVIFLLFPFPFFHKKLLLFQHSHICTMLKLLTGQKFNSNSFSMLSSSSNRQKNIKEKPGMIRTWGEHLSHLKTTFFFLRTPPTPHK